MCALCCAGSKLWIRSAVWARCDAERAGEQGEEEEKWRDLVNDGPPGLPRDPQ